MYREKEKEGKHLVDNPSLFLHSVQEKNGMISIEAGVYSYFQRISFVYDFERETYRRVYGKFLKKSRLEENICQKIYHHPFLHKILFH